MGYVEKQTETDAPPRHAPEMPGYSSGFGVAPYQHVPPDKQWVPDDDDSRAPAASRGARFVARLIDGALVGVAAAPGVLAGLIDSHLYGTPFALMAIGILAICSYQWLGIVRSGQTIGKRLLHIKVTRNDGSPVTFLDGVVIREWAAALLGIIPFLGRFIQLGGYLMIFGKEQKCLHDHLAKTRVVVHRDPRPSPGSSE